MVASIAIFQWHVGMSCVHKITDSIFEIIIIIIIIIIIMNDIYPGSSTHPKVVFRKVLHPIELE